MDQEGPGRSLAERLAALTPEKRALLELALKARQVRPTVAPSDAPGPRLGLEAVLQTESFATLAPFPEVAPAFSWLLAAQGRATPSQVALVREAHQDLRGVLFRSVDLAGGGRILSWSVGAGHELVDVARRSSLSRIVGLASSPEELVAARARVRARGLQERIEVVGGPPEGTFDVAFGLESLRRVESPRALFASLGEAVREGGRLVLGDLFLRTTLSLPHLDRLSLPLLDSLVEWLGESGFEVLDCVDAGREVGNFLQESEPGAGLAQLGWEAGDSRLAVASAYESLGGLLRGGAASYLLLTAEKRRGGPREPRDARNRERLARAQPFAELPHTWLYAPRWRPVARQTPPEAPVASSPEHCLIFSDGAGVGAALSRLVEEAGGRCVFVLRGEGFQQEDAAHFTVFPRNPEDFQKLVKALGETGFTPTRVVYLWGLDVPAPEGQGVAALQDAALDACGGALYLTQALLQGKTGVGTPASLWVVTRGAQCLDDTEEAPGLLGAPLWGVGKAIAYEHPELDCHRVDLDARDGVEDAARSLGAELRVPGREDQVLLRAAERHVLRLERHRQWAWERAGHLQFRSDATYLVTGGLGGLGLQVARWMVERGARHMVLLGRKRASDVSTREVGEMRARGASIVSLAGVSVDSDLDFVMAGISKRMPPLRGIVHAATEVDDGILVHQTRERLGRVFAEKVGGAWNLHRWLAGAPLDFFHLLSSSTSLMGASGQVSHLAATAFLDGLAVHRRSRGLPGQSSSWGAWAAPDDVAAKELEARMRKRGVGMVPLARAFSVLEQVFGPVPAVVGVMPIHWPTFLASLPGEGPPPLFADFAAEDRTDRATDGARRELLRRVRAGSPEDGRRAVLAWFQAQVSRVLELGAAQTPEPEQTLHELGLDSLMGVELKKHIHAELRVDVPLQSLLEGRSVGALAESLYEALR
ncbi:KR domain-containing protein [Myxococcus sp. K15C18031901]|uniref:KR domain-containing protein n=1 Tax=Myxococcus dinghuensis TaxID=2906761 RepID=UPI0020A79E53|nr:KR domain-containing protein [Myxococcus dinghuensis]MCP3102829.1 KR domain-containing protein [Myxococcus dinghuensis]